MDGVPEELLYTVEHEWVRCEEGVATVGITDCAQGELGDIVYVDLPAEGRVLARGDVFGTIEAVKAVSELFAPLAGEVIAMNPRLAAEAQLVNKGGADGAARGG